MIRFILTLILLLTCISSAFAGRYYSSENGRFVSRDGLGYVDGMSLYNAYFAPNFLDPSGHGITVNRVNPFDRIPYKWVDEKLLVGLDKNAGGLYVPLIAVSCECVPCEESCYKEGEERIDCTITLDERYLFYRDTVQPHIDVINRLNDAETAATTVQNLLSGLWGHEQRHALATNNKLWLRAREYMTESDECRTSCNSDGLQSDLEGMVKKVLKEEADHTPNPNPLTPTPPAGGARDPITPVPDGFGPSQR